MTTENITWRPRALLLTTVSPHRPRQGDAWRAYGLLQGLMRVADVTVVQWGGESTPEHRVVPDAPVAKAVRALRALPSGLPLSTLPYRAGFPFVPGHFGLVVGLSLKTARWALSVPAPIHVLDLADSLGLLRERLDGRAYWLRRLRLTGVEREEREWADRFTETWVASDADAEYLRKRGVEAAVVPNGAAARHEAPWVSPRNLLFVGNLAYPPNRTGLAEFVRTVWPHLFAAGYCLTLAGRGTERYRGVPGVVARGLVDDVAPLYQACGVAVSPVRVGAGSPTKVLEALSWGRPVVGWESGFAGLSDQQRGAVLAVNTPEDWLAALRRLERRDEWEARRDAGLRAVELWGEAQASRFRTLLDPHSSTTFAGPGTVTVGAAATKAHDESC
jgi:glycosyltransferase involved in cell wall biosynthesis